LESNSTLLHLFLRMPNSPLLSLIATLPAHNSMRVQPEIKMADVKLESLKPDIADGI